MSDWQKRLAKRRGTAATRKLAFDAQAPISWNDRTLAGVRCERCGQPVDPIHNCTAATPGGAGNPDGSRTVETATPAQQRKPGGT
jgi:hypothetical protein